MRAVVDEILKSQVHITLGLMILWSILGVVVGIVVAFLAYFILSKLGAWRLEWKHGKWIRLLTMLWLLGTCGFLLALAGCLEGGGRGVNRVVEKSQFRTEVLQPLGRAGAVGIVFVDGMLEDRHADASARVDSFMKGERELDVRAFLERLDRADTTFVQGVVADVMPKVRAKVKLPESRLVDLLLEKILEFLVRRTIKEKLKEKFGEESTAGVSEFFRTLPAAAEAKGDPATIGYDDLSDHAVEHGLIPAILEPTRHLIRAKQTVLLLLTLGSILLPVIGFWIGRIVERKRKARAPAATPPSASDAPRPGTGPSPPAQG